MSESYWDLAYNPEGDLIYATALEQGFISVINSSNKVSSQNEISDDGDYPKIAIRDREANLRGVIYKPESNLTGVTYFPDNHSLYVISPNKLNNQVPKYSIFVINSDGELVKQIPISIDNPVNDIKYNSDNKYLYLSLGNDNSVVVVDTLSNKIINRISAVGNNPAGIDYNPENKLIYVTNRNLPFVSNGSVSVINSSNVVIKNITGVGKNPSDIAYNPDNKFMYVTDEGVSLSICYQLLLQ